MENERKGIKNSGAWVGVGTVIGAALSWRKPKKSKINYLFGN